MIVDNPRNQFEEAYRVLQPNSTAAFTIWGDRDHCLQFTIVDDVVKEHLTDEQRENMPNERSNFDLFYKFPIEQTLKEIGFTKLKMWMQPINIAYEDGQDFLKA